MDKKRLILIDTNNLAYRAFYALPDTISTSTGTMTNAVFGFTSMLLKLLEEQKPDVVIGAFDSRGPTFRHDISADYKATRKKMPDELTQQMPLIKEILSSFNIPSIQFEGYEADDIIATAVEQSLKRFDEIIIVSSDKDILQLVSKKVSVIAIKKGVTDTVTYDLSNVSEKFGVEPTLIQDYLALTGDVSDNIPGVPGIGPKTAMELIQEFGSIEMIYKNLERIKSDRIQKLLAENKKSAEISKSLTVLNRELDVDLEDAYGNVLGETVDFDRVEHIFNTFEFNTLNKKLDVLSGIYGREGQAAGTTLSRQETGTDIERPPVFRKKLFLDSPGQKNMELEKNSRFYFSIIYTGPGNTHRGPSGYEGGLIIMDQSENFHCFSNKFLAGAGAPEKNRLIELLERDDITKSGYDFKIIFKFLKKNKLDLKGRVIDFKVMYLLLNPVKPDTEFDEILASTIGTGLDNIYKIDLELDMQGNFDKDNGKINETLLASDQIEFGFGSKNQGHSISLANKGFLARIKEMLYYKRIDDILTDRIEKEDLHKVYYEIEEPLIKILADMESTGVNIDLNYLSVLIKEYDIDINYLTCDIYRLCDAEFNINSTQQLARILYEDLKLPATKKTKTGFSTDAVTLLSIIDSHPVIGKILDYREKVKLKNTYIDVLPNLIDPYDGRIHTTYNQLGTTTGRISSSNPNLQNIPVRSELGRQIRKAFIPGKDYDLLMSADYSQIELRILAHLAEDTDLVEAFNSGQDIHSRTASEIFGVPYDDVDENLRRKAKAINFGILYGMTEFGLKSRLSISEEEARDYIKLYFSRYPGVKKYINHLIESAYKTGYSTTIFGRKRYMRELSSTNINIRNLGERLAVNTPIQGSAADIMKLATIRLHNSINERNLDSNIILHVHDELVLEFKEKDQDGLEKLVVDSMENCVDLRAKLKVDIKTSRNWYV